MNNVMDFFDEHFFVIDKNNCSNVHSKFYGYAFYNNILYINEHPNFLIPPRTIGQYINIYKYNSNIIIQQDYWGSYGIFYYHDKNYWAISNSFFKLFLYLKSKNVRLNLNNQYLKYFIREQTASLSVSETPVLQISQLQKDIMINIDTDLKAIEFDTQYMLTDWKYDINSSDGIKIIDEWHKKWQSLAKKLINERKITIDLTGGFDSRAAFSIFSHLNLNKNSVNVSSPNDRDRFNEDFKIATKISNIYCFTLNKKLHAETVPLDDNTSLLISLMSCILFRNLYYFKTSCYKNYEFHFGGYGGESLRAYWKSDQNEFIRKVDTLYNDKFTIHDECTKNILMNSFSEIKKVHYDNRISDAKFFYNHTRVKTHFLRFSLEYFLSNSLILSPLFDPSLRQLKLKNDFCSDENLLFALIYCRFLPELSQIEFDSNKKIDDETKVKAMELCKLYPFYEENDNDDNNISIISKEIMPIITDNTSKNRIDQKFSSLVKSEMVMHISRSKFSSDEIWEKACQNLEKMNFYDDSLAHVLNSIVILERIMNRHNFDINNILDLFKYTTIEKYTQKILNNTIRNLWIYIKKNKKSVFKKN